MPPNALNLINHMKLHVNGKMGDDYDDERTKEGTRVRWGFSGLKILKWNNLRGKIKRVQSKKWTSPIDDQDLNAGVVPVAPQKYAL